MIKQVADDFARYLYLPRLITSDVLAQSIGEGLALLTWQADTFAYAESYDEGAGRYRGLRCGQSINVAADSSALLVKPNIAQRQLEAEIPATPSVPNEPGNGDQPVQPSTSNGGSPGGSMQQPSVEKLRRFHGSVKLDSSRVGRDAGRIADEVIAHLAGQMGAEVTVTIEIEARLPDGASDQLVRIVTENSRTLKFDSQGFEKD